MDTSSYIRTFDFVVPIEGGNSDVLKNYSPSDETVYIKYEWHSFERRVLRVIFSISYNFGNWAYLISFGLLKTPQNGDFVSIFYHDVTLMPQSVSLRMGIDVVWQSLVQEQLHLGLGLGR